MLGAPAKLAARLGRVHDRRRPEGRDPLRPRREEAESRQSLGKRLMLVATNLRDTRFGKTDWPGLSHGAALAAVGHALGNRYGTVLIGSSAGYRDLRFWGSHPLTDPMFTSSRVRILHDGAAFIRDDRVIAAGCFLPLSRNPQLARQLGTRHRAALGVTEETDAVAVVVSEETGRLSLAVDGGIEALSGPDALRRRLLTLLGAETKVVPAFWRGWLRALRLRTRPAGPPSSPAP